MSEEQEIKNTEVTEDVEGHNHGMKKHGGLGGLGGLSQGAQDEELNDEEDDVEGHSHGMKKHGGLGNLGGLSEK